MVHVNSTRSEEVEQGIPQGSVLDYFNSYLLICPCLLTANYTYQSNGVFPTKDNIKNILLNRRHNYGHCKTSL